VHLVFPDSCTLDYRFTSISSPPAPQSQSQALVAAQVGLSEALLFAPGVGCDIDFSSCSFPPP
jgi:hypothetical protein